MKRIVFFIIIAASTVSVVYAYTQDDIMVWSSANSEFYMSHTKDAPTYIDGVADSTSGWGTAGDFSPLVGDVDGDGVDDIAVLRNNGSRINWYAAHSAVTGSGVGSLGDGSSYSQILDFGWSSVNVKNFLSNVNGDAYDDAVTVDNSGGALYWSAGHSTAAGLGAATSSSMNWGWAGDTALMGDFNGDGRDDATIFNSGAWYVGLSTASGLSSASTASASFGAAGDIPLVGDINGDGRDDGVIVRNNGDGQAHWYVGYSNAAGKVAGDGWLDMGNYGWLSIDTPLLADINGDGKDDIGVYRQTVDWYSAWYFQFTGGGGSYAGTNFGWYSNVPLIGQFDGNYDYAYKPIPEDNGGGPQGLTLQWTKGLLTVQNDIYFGSDFNAVNDANRSDTTGIYRERTSNTSYVPVGLAEFTRYYWRIDDVDGTGNIIHKGDVWNFLTAREVDSDSWVAVDALSREVSDYDRCGPVRDDKFVGIFYFTWHVQDVGPYDITEILAADPTVPQWNPDSPQYQTDTVPHFHHWGQPELGYYYATDEYVIRKHVQMLANAGVDVMILDATNAYTYRDVYLTICEVLRQIRAEGGKTPQICFITYFYSVETVQQLYNEFYSRGLYKDLWFYWNGKPLIFATDDHSFFTVRKSWAWTNQYPPDSFYNQYKWQWIDDFPQQYGWDVSGSQPTQMPAAVAQHPTLNIGTSFQNGSQPAINAYGLTAYTGQGRHFAEQAEWALQIDPEFLFITGWNEWIAQRFLVGEGDYQYFIGGYRYESETFFVDTYNQEYNRDIEPMKNGHTDNYYYQLVDYIRRFKGVSPTKTPSKPKTIVIDGNSSDWSDIKPEYRDNLYDTTHRNCRGFGTAGPYVNTTGRNDFAASKVSYDDDYVYFYIETRQNITSYSDTNWMLLFIDSDVSKSTGWQGYDYLINYGGVGVSTTTLKQNIGGWPSWNTVDSGIVYAVSGNKLELRIPRNEIGQGGSAVKFEFKWADNIQNTNDVMEFAVSGDSAPDRRFNYVYDASLPARACQEVFDDGQGNNMDLNTDCTLDIDDLVLFAAAWLDSYNFGDFADLADDWLADYTPESIEDAVVIFEDGFESGNFSQHPWNRYGHTLWTIVSDAHTGSFSAKSGAIANSQWSTLAVQVSVPNNAYISFYVKISSQLNYDFLRFYIDGVEQYKWSGTILPWLMTDFPVAAGTRTFTWEYKKNDWGYSGSDCVWLDDIQLIEK